MNFCKYRLIRWRNWVKSLAVGLCLYASVSAGNTAWGASPWLALHPSLRGAISAIQGEAEPWFNELGIKFRVSLACLMLRMIEDPGVPPQLLQIHDLSRGGDASFLLRSDGTHGGTKRSEKALMGFLERRGYTDQFGASHGRRWGLRSHNYGAFLHWSAPENSLGVVNVHIDLKNPGTSGLFDIHKTIRQGAGHLFADFLGDAWFRNHTPSRLVEEVPAGCGLGQDDLREARSIHEF
jgi:hypothetical protein